MVKQKQVPSDVKNLLLSEWEQTIKMLKGKPNDGIIKENTSFIWRSPGSRSVKNSSGVRFTPL